jgi:hypothetical protein
MRMSSSTATTLAALFISLLALVISLGGAGYAANGGNFLLGLINSATQRTALSANYDGTALALVNTSAGASATALTLSVAAGHPPMKVNSTAKVLNLNADWLDGLTSAAFVRTDRTAFADFYALMPGDNATTVGVGTAVSFPNIGPTSASGIAQLSPSTFNIATPGVYLVNFQVSVTEAGQLILAANGLELPSTVVGRTTGTSQIVGVSLIRTTVANTVLEVRNPAGNLAALTITPSAGGTHAVSAHLTILRVQ